MTRTRSSWLATRKQIIYRNYVVGGPGYKHTGVDLIKLERAKSDAALHKNHSTSRFLLKLRLLSH